MKVKNDGYKPIYHRMFSHFHSFMYTIYQTFNYKCWKNVINEHNYNVSNLLL